MSSPRRASLKSPLSSRRSSVHPVDDDLEADLDALESGNSPRPNEVARAGYSPTGASRPLSASRRLPQVSTGIRAGVSLSVFNEVDRERLRKYDASGDGFLETDDIVRAFDGLVALSSGGFPLSAFSDDVADKLKAFDSNANGYLEGDEILKAFQALDGLKSGAIPIDSFPPDIQPGLRSHDDGDGTLDAHEIAKAFQVLEETNKASQSGGIAISSFPEKAQEKLRALDGTGDGVIDAAEVLAGVEALHREKNKVRQLMWLSAGLLLFSLCLLGAMGGLMFSVIEMTKEAKIGGSGVMTVKGSNAPVQTASSDMTVTNGVLSTRPGTDQTGRRWINGRRAGCQDDGSCALTTQSTQVSTARPLSSLIEDPYFEELKTLKIVQGNSWVQFSVLAVARYAEAGSRHGSVVVLFTHIGELTLDGEAMFFHESIAGAFSRAGLKVDANGRRLLGIVEIIGLFNLLESAFADSGLKDDEMPRMPGNQFMLEMTKLTYCDDATNEQRRNAGLPHGAGGCMIPLDVTSTEWREVDWVSEYHSRKALISTESLISAMIDGVAYGKSVQSSDQYPGQNIVEIMNATHRLVYQSHNDVAFHCQLEESDALADLQKGDDSMRRSIGGGARRLNDKDDKGTTVTFEGFVTIDDIYCRKFIITQDMAITVGNGAALPGQEQPKTQMEITLYEDYSKRQVYRIEMYGSAWVINDLKSLHSPEENPTSDEMFDMETILAQCAREDIVSPEKITIGLLTDRVMPDDFVGQTYEVAAAFFNSTWNMTNTTSRRSETIDLQGTGFPGLSDDAYDSQGNLIDPEVFVAQFAQNFDSQVAQMKAMGKLKPGKFTGKRRSDDACWSFLPLIPDVLIELFMLKFGAKFDITICTSGQMELIISTMSDDDKDSLKDKQGGRRMSPSNTMMSANMTAGDSARSLLAVDQYGNELETKEVGDGRRQNVCPEVSGVLTLGANLVTKDFSVEGCFHANFPLLECYAVAMMPAIEPAIAGINMAADKFNVDISLPSLTLSICAYLKKIGTESADCKAKRGSQMELGYNPGMSAAAVVGMSASIAIPDIKRVCTRQCLKYKACCKKWKWYWKKDCATVCVDVPYVKNFVLAAFEAGISADFPMEVMCASNRKAGSSLRLGTAVVAHASMYSDLVPVAKLKASIQLFPWKGGNKCSFDAGGYTFKQDKGKDSDKFSFAMVDLGFGSCFK